MGATLLRATRATLLSARATKVRQSQAPGRKSSRAAPTTDMKRPTWKLAGL